MKLIDILVEETIKNGWSWPERANCITQDSDREIVSAGCHQDDAKFCSYRHGWNLKASRIESFESRILADDYASSIITREQYEAALAEKEHPLPWDEKNKPCPTIGAECRGCPDCGRRVSCASDDITDDAVRAEMGMNSRALDAALAARNDGWIAWGGGECPVADFLKVEYQLRGGAKGSESAKILEWQHEGGRHDIIAYRLHKPQEATETDDEADLNECIGHDVTPVWSGDGKPTMGTKCEHHSGGQWEVVTIAGIYENLVTGFTDYWMVREDGSSYTVGNPYRFRPIRSEADKKRDEAVAAMLSVFGSNAATGTTAALKAIYDSIAAGEITVVKLED